MASWLDKARGKTPSADSVPFTRKCECGFLIKGVRAERAKRQVCSDCGAAHFILPVNQYPETERSLFEAGQDEEAELAVPQTGTPSSGDERKDATAEIESDREGETDSTFSRRKFSADRKSSRQAHGGRSAEKKKSRKKRRAEPEDIYEYDDEEFDDIEEDLHGGSSQSKVIAGVDEDGWQRGSKKRKRLKPKTEKTVSGPIPAREKNKPFLPIFSAFVVIAAGMIIWLLSSRARENAEIELKESMDVAEQEFFEGNYPQAYQALIKADEALQILGITDDRAKTVREMKRQAEASTLLLDASVMELVEAAALTIRESGESRWQTDFSVNYEGRWLVMQLPVPSTVNERSRLNYDWIVDGRPILLEGLGTVATWAVTQGDLKEILCAARLKNCRREEKWGEVWIVEFDPNTAFLWTDETSLIRQNMIPVFDDSISTAMRKIVKQQREIGDAPPPPPPLEDGERAPDMAEPPTGLDSGDDE